MYISDLNYLLSLCIEVLFPSILALKILSTMFHNCFNNSAFTSRVFYFLHNVLMHRFKCFINMSESLAIGLELEWKILRSFLFLYPKTNTDGSLKFINSLNNFLNLFLIMALLLISCNSGLKRFKILIL